MKPPADSGLTPRRLRRLLADLEAAVRATPRAWTAAVLPLALHYLARRDAVVLGADGLRGQRGTPGDAVATIAFAAGLAIAKNRRCVVAVVAASDYADAEPILRFVAKRNLPLVIVAGATNRGRARDYQRTLFRLPLPCITVDGNDPIAVYRVAREAVFRARYGDGPALLDCVMDLPLARGRGGCRDAVEFLRSYLRSRGVAVGRARSAAPDRAFDVFTLAPAIDRKPVRFRPKRVTARRQRRASGR
jgi:hypothetical protein